MSEKRNRTRDGEVNNKDKKGGRRNMKDDGKKRICRRN